MFPCSNSTGWRHSPLRIYEEPEKGWRVLFGKRFGAHGVDGAHDLVYSIEKVADMKQFLEEEFERLDEPEGETFQPVENSLRVVSCQWPPRLLKMGTGYPMKVVVENTGEVAIAPEDGILLHARWIDLAGDHKFSYP